MNPIPYHGRFLYPGSSTPFPSSPPLRFEPNSFKLPTPTYSIPSPPVFRFDPINTKFPTPTYSIPPSPVFSYSAPDLNNLKIEFPKLEYRPMHPAPHVPSPLEQKVMCIFLLTLVWGYTAVIVANIASEKGFAKRYVTSMALIGATAVTALTYANIPLGLASIAIITLIGCVVCKPSISYMGPRDVYYPPYRFNPPILNWQPPVQPRLPMHLPPLPPVNYHPLFQADDLRLMMTLHYPPFNPPNYFRVEQR